MSASVADRRPPWLFGCSQERREEERRVLTATRAFVRVGELNSQPADGLQCQDGLLYSNIHILPVMPEFSWLTSRVLKASMYLSPRRVLCC